MLEDLTPPAKKAVPCKIRTIANDLDESDSAIFIAAVNDLSTWQTHVLAAELKRRGVQVSETSLRKHRRKECSCSMPATTQQ